MTEPKLNKHNTHNRNTSAKPRTLLQRASTVANWAINFQLHPLPVFPLYYISPSAETLALIERRNYITEQLKILIKKDYENYKILVLAQRKAEELF